MTEHGPDKAAALARRRTGYSRSAFHHTLNADQLASELAEEIGTRPTQEIRRQAFAAVQQADRLLDAIYRAQPKWVNPCAKP